MSNAHDQSSEPVAAATTRADPGRLLGLTVILVDETVTSGDLLDRTVAELERCECDLLATKELGPVEKRQIEEHIGRARGSASPLTPATLLVIQDLAVAELQGVSSGADSERQSSLQARIDHRLRQQLHQGRERSCVHISRNTQAAWQCVTSALAERAEDLLAEARRRATAYRSPFPVVRRLSPHVQRAKVELVDYQGRAAVLKTFRIGKERFLRREVLAHVELSRQIEGIPRALAHGENWILVPYIEDTLGSSFRQLRFLPLPYAKHLIRFLEALYEAGYAHMDFSLKNALFDRAGKLWVVDFEFLHRYERRPDSFEESYDVVGPPAHFAGDLPEATIVRTYDRRLRKNTGLSLESLRGDPEWKQHLKRSIYFGTATLPRRIWWHAYRSWQRFGVRTA
ncbi:hypothetical protein BH23GEM7_BH23GEM7_19990 [soil metagenome]|nr:hypothetical protein [Gemmatimonadota bacterium]